MPLYESYSASSLVNDVAALLITVCLGSAHQERSLTSPSIPFSKSYIISTSALLPIFPVQEPGQCRVYHSYGLCSEEPLFTTLKSFIANTGLSYGSRRMKSLLQKLKCGKTFFRLDQAINNFSRMLSGGGNSLADQIY